MQAGSAEAHARDAVYQSHPAARVRADLGRSVWASRRRRWRAAAATLRAAQMVARGAQGARDQGFSGVGGGDQETTA